MVQKRRLYLLLVFVFAYLNVANCLTRQQMKNSVKLLQKTCMGKTGVGEDKVKQLSKGIFVEEREVMCYFACLYQMSQIVKNNKLDYEASLKQVDMVYPNDMKEAAKRSLETCKDEYSKSKDLCEASFRTAKCIYEADPKNFVFI